MGTIGRQIRFGVKFLSTDTSSTLETDLVSSFWEFARTMLTETETSSVGEDNIHRGSFSKINTESDNVSMSENICQSPLDPLDPRKLSLDIFELYCHEMIITESVGRRGFLINQMRFMIRRLIGQQFDYGRLYNRTCIANIVARVCGREAYCKEDEETNESYFNEKKKNDDNVHALEKYLIDLDSEKWNKIIDQFESLRKSLTRADATLIVLPTQCFDSTSSDEHFKEDSNSIPECDERIDLSVESTDLFSKKYFQMMDWMKFHSCLSHIQPQLEQAVQSVLMSSSLEEQSVVISVHDILSFHNALHRVFADDMENKYAVILSSLLDFNENISRSTRHQGVRLKSFSQIRAIYLSNQKEFNLERFQSKFLTLIRQWTTFVLPIPKLVKLGYGSMEADYNSDAQESNFESYWKIAKVHNFHVDTSRKTTMIESQSSPITYTGQKTSNYSHPSVRVNHLNERESPSLDDKDSQTVVFRGEMQEESKALKNLNQKRNMLMKEVNDPLEDSIEMSQSLRTCGQLSSPSKGRLNADNTHQLSTFLRRKTSAHQLEFTDSETSQDEGHHYSLSEIPQRFKIPTEGKSLSHPFRAQLNGECSSRRKKKFTEIEDNAIRLGVDRFGVGKWVDIKSYYFFELKERDAVQIKDRYRTMIKSLTTTT